MGKILTSVVMGLVLLSVQSGTAQAGSIQIRAKIAAVRIVVVDEHDQITEMYSNTDKMIMPEVRQEKVGGAKIKFSDAIKTQYQQISHTIPKGVTGRVYKRPLFPSLLEILYAML